MNLRPKTRPALRRRINQARHHAAALAILLVFYLPPAVYALTAMTRTL